MGGRPGSIYLRPNPPARRRRRAGGGMALREHRDDGLDDRALAVWLVGVAQRDTDALAVLYGQTSPRLLAVL